MYTQERYLCWTWRSAAKIILSKDYLLPGSISDSAKKLTFPAPSLYAWAGAPPVKPHPFKVAPLSVDGWWKLKGIANFLAVMYLLQTCLPGLPRPCQAYVSQLFCPNPRYIILFLLQVVVSKSIAYLKFHISIYTSTGNKPVTPGIRGVVWGK